MGLLSRDDLGMGLLRNRDSALERSRHTGMDGASRRLHRELENVPGCRGSNSPRLAGPSEADNRNGIRRIHILTFSRRAANQRTRARSSWHLTNEHTNKMHLHFVAGFATGLSTFLARDSDSGVRRATRNAGTLGTSQRLRRIHASAAACSETVTRGTFHGMG